MKLLNRYEAWCPVRIILDETPIASFDFMKQMGNASKTEVQALKDNIDKYMFTELDSQQSMFLISEIRRNMTKSRIVIFEKLIIHHGNIYEERKATQIIEKLNLWNNRDFVFLFTLKGNFEYIPQYSKYFKEILQNLVSRNGLDLSKAKHLQNEKLSRLQFSKMA